MRTRRAWILPGVRHAAAALPSSAACDGPRGLGGDVDDADSPVATVGQGDADVVSRPGAEERFPDG